MKSIITRVLLKLTFGTYAKLYRKRHPFIELPNVISPNLGDYQACGMPGDLRCKVLVGMNISSCGDRFHCRMSRKNLCDRLGETIIGFTMPGRMLR